MDLKNPHFRYTGYPAAPPPGSHTKSPTEVYFATAATNQTVAGAATVTDPVALANGCGTTTYIAAPIPTVGTAATTTGQSAVIFPATGEQGSAAAAAATTMFVQQTPPPVTTIQTDMGGTGDNTFVNGGWSAVGG